MYIFYKKIAFAVSVIAMTFWCLPVFAAQVFFETQDFAVVKGQQFMVSVFLDTRNDSVNALEGDVIVPQEYFAIKQVRDGNSAVPFWVERPQAGDSGKVHFSGIMPGGYNSQKVFLFSLVLEAMSQGFGGVDVQNMVILKNDGKATALPVSSAPINIKILDGDDSATKTSGVIQDSVLPENFVPQLLQDPEIFDGKFLLVFSAQDKDSGIDHYEIKEGRSGNFINAQSPYLLQNQNIDQEIFVKAVDKSKNERVEVFYPPRFKHWYQRYWLFGIIILIVCCVGIFIKKIW